MTEPKERKTRVLEPRLTPIPPTKKRVRRTKEEIKPHYVDAVVMEQLILKYYEDGVLTNELAGMIQKIAVRLGFAQNFVNYCVDEKTEALTERGWLNGDNITEKDRGISLDIKNGNLQWCNINSVYRGEHSGVMYRLQNHDFDALVTPGHKFISLEDGVGELKTIEDINEKDKIILRGYISEKNSPIYGYFENEDESRRYERSRSFSTMPKKELVPYVGKVWCPETEHGNFLCRREGQVYITGNSFRDEMTGDAVVKMIAALIKKNFKCGIGYSPFSYFTKIAYRAFQNRVKEEKKIHEGAQKYQEHVYNMLMESGEIPFQKNIHTDDGSGGYDPSLENV